MSRLQTPGHQRAVAILQIAGPILALIGLAFMIFGLVNFFMAFGSFGPPRYFWCLFAGMPLLFVGAVLSMFGYMGTIARFTAAQQVPIATDAITDLADGTQDAVKTVARSVTEGVREGMGEKKME